MPKSTKRQPFDQLYLLMKPIKVLLIVLNKRTWLRCSQPYWADNFPYASAPRAFGISAVPHNKQAGLQRSSIIQGIHSVICKCGKNPISSSVVSNWFSLINLPVVKRMQTIILNTNRNLCWRTNSPYWSYCAWVLCQWHRIRSNVVASACAA